jgi:hypothetical protein
MPGVFYKLGVSQTLKTLGLAPEEDHTLRNVGVGAAAVSPFAGLIGQKAITQDPFTNETIPRRNLRDISQMARPGDVIATTEPRWSGWKLFQSPVTGTEFYHSFPVVARRGNAATAVTAGELAEPEYQRMTTTGLKRKLEELRGGLIREGYRDVVLLRPREGMSPEQIRELQQTLLERAKTPYAPRRGVEALLRDIFVPKIPGLENLGQPVCSGNVCSTLPAQSQKLVTGTDVVKGKPAKHVLTADYLREGSPYEAIAARVASKPRFSPRTTKLLGLGARAGLGLGLGAAAYGISEDPALAAVPIGAIAAPALGRTISQRLAIRRAQQQATQQGKTLSTPALQTAKREGYNAFRPFKQFVEYLGAKEPADLKKFRNITRRTIPLALAGGAATYLGAKGIERLIKQD